MSVTDRLWQHTLPVYEAILAHPFIDELDRHARASVSSSPAAGRAYLRDFARPRHHQFAPAGRAGGAASDWFRA